HNLDEAERLADKIGVLKHRLIALDSPSNLRKRLFGQALVAELANGDEDLAAWAMQFQGVHHADWRQDRLHVMVDDLTAVTPRLVAALVSAGAQILRVAPESASLEDVYLQLVGEETA